MLLLSSSLWQHRQLQAHQCISIGRRARLPTCWKGSFYLRLVTVPLKRLPARSFSCTKGSGTLCPTLGQARQRYWLYYRPRDLKGSGKRWRICSRNQEANLTLPLCCRFSKNTEWIPVENQDKFNIVPSLKKREICDN